MLLDDEMLESEVPQELTGAHASAALRRLWEVGMESLRLYFSVGVGGPYLEILGYEDMQRPRASVLYRGQCPDTESGPVTARELVESLVGELCNVRDLIPDA